MKQGDGKGQSFAGASLRLDGEIIILDHERHCSFLHWHCIDEAVASERADEFWMEVGL